MLYQEQYATLDVLSFISAIKGPDKWWKGEGLGFTVFLGDVSVLKYQVLIKSFVELE